MSRDDMTKVSDDDEIRTSRNARGLKRSFLSEEERNLSRAFPSRPALQREILPAPQVVVRVSHCSFTASVLPRVGIGHTSFQGLCHVVGIWR